MQKMIDIDGKKYEVEILQSGWIKFNGNTFYNESYLKLWIRTMEADKNIGA